MKNINPPKGKNINGTLNINEERQRISKLLSEVNTICTKGKAEKVSYSSASNPILDVDSLHPELRFGFPYRISGNGPKTVAYFTNMLLDWHTKEPRFGGGERYALNLATLLKKLGFIVHFYQVAPEPFEGEYYGFPVRALRAGKGFSEFQIGAAEEFYQISLDYDCVIYNLPEYSSARMRTDAIMITHGIWFDHNNYPHLKIRQNEWFSRLYRAFSNPKRIVSVDTNSISVIRSIWPHIADKMVFIPNFVDHSTFHPPAERKTGKLTVVFPRRSQINRGSRILPEILSRVPHDVDIYWIGRGDKYDTELIEKLTETDGRLKFLEASFEEMADWYRKADIVVIPTIACEGTSLSCIEAMASGCATIATTIGGLPNFIIDGYNGRLVNPTAKDIADAINELISNEGLRISLAKNGYESSFAFSLPSWQNKWIGVLEGLGWISKNAESAPSLSGMKPSHPKVVIVTKNGYHGGVESLIKIEADDLGAEVVVAGGLDDPIKTCPFTYRYVNTYDELRGAIKEFDFVLYHYPPPWAVEAIGDSQIPSMEFVHRADTSELDKSVPTAIASHSKYLCNYINENFNRTCELIPNAVDVNHYRPGETRNKDKKIIGVVAQLYKIKGLDVLIQGWAAVHTRYPQYRFCIYGTGEQEKRLRDLAKELEVPVEFMGVVSDPAKVYQDELGLFITTAKLEGFPIAIIEAMACNVPIIASDIEGHKAVNEMAREGGFAEPLILFKSEDPSDLAEKLDNYLKGGLREVDSRTLVTSLFSSDRHTGLIMQHAIKTIASRSTYDKQPNVNIMELVNDGQFISEKDPFGFHFMGLNRATVLNNNHIQIFNDAYIGHLAPLSEDITKISYSIELTRKLNAPIYVQFELVDDEGNNIHITGQGLNANSKNIIHSIYSIPSDLKQRPSKVRLVLRPNKNFDAEVSKIKMGFWK